MAQQHPGAWEPLVAGLGAVDLLLVGVLVVVLLAVALVAVWCRCAAPTVDRAVVDGA